MRKLGNGKGRRVHPAPPPGAAPRDHLAVLPTAVLALAAALTAEEQEVLAYLISGGGGGERWRERRRRRAHPPELGCGCFGCYKSFWARWDASPNRHVIHRIIDAVEERLESRERDRGGGDRRRRRSGRGGRKGADLEPEVASASAAEETLEVEMKRFLALDGGRLADDDGDDYDDDDDGSSVDDNDGYGVDDGDYGKEIDGGSNTNTNGGKSSVRRFMCFIGERVWGVWN